MLALSIELKRRSLNQDDESNTKKILELSAYFTIPKLEVKHRQLALLSAMNIALRRENYKSALSFANRMLANGIGAKMLESVSLIMAPSPLTDD